MGKKKIAEIVRALVQAVLNAKTSGKDISKHKGSGRFNKKRTEAFLTVLKAKIKRRLHHINVASGPCVQCG